MCPRAPDGVTSPVKPDADAAPPVITIDGPTASGKGTVAQQVARALGFHYLDSGALYRVTALAAQKHGVDLDDGPAVAGVAQAITVRFGEDGVVLLDGQDVSDAIRTEQSGQGASRVAVHPAVRAALLDLQRRCRRAPGLVADGRDMATVVFPDAPTQGLPDRERRSACGQTA